MTKIQQQYNNLLKRINNAEEIMNNIDKLRLDGKITKEDDFYIDAFKKLVILLGEKGLEVENELKRKMTYEERHKGF